MNIIKTNAIMMSKASQNEPDNCLKLNEGSTLSLTSTATVSEAIVFAPEAKLTVTEYLPGSVLSLTLKFKNIVEDCPCDNVIVFEETGSAKSSKFAKFKLNKPVLSLFVNFTGMVIKSHCSTVNNEVKAENLKDFETFFPENSATASKT